MRVETVAEIEKQAKLASAQANQIALAQREREKQHIAQQLNEWKSEVAKAKEAEQQRKKKEEEDKLLEQREKEMKKRAIIKEKLKEYALERELQRGENQVVTDIKPPRPKVTVKDLEKFQQKDRELLVNKQKQSLSKEIEKAAQADRLEKLRSQVQVNVHRDPCRITKPTVAYESHIGAEQEYQDKYASLAFTGAFATRRAVPAWRQGL